MLRSCYHASVFLSYSHDVVEVAEAVYNHLRINNCDVFFDKAKLKAGDFDKNIRKAISRSDIFVLLVSEAFFRNESYAIAEYEIALRRFRSKPTKIIPVIADESVKFQQLDPFLRSLQVISVPGNLPVRINEAVDALRTLKPLCRALILGGGITAVVAATLVTLPPLTTLSVQEPTLIDIRPTVSPPISDDEIAADNRSWTKSESLVTVPLKLSRPGRGGGQPTVLSAKARMLFDKETLGYQWLYTVDLANGGRSGDDWLGYVGPAGPFDVPEKASTTEMMFQRDARTTLRWDHLNKRMRKIYGQDPDATAEVQVDFSVRKFFGPVHWVATEQVRCRFELRDAVGQIESSKDDEVALYFTLDCLPSDPQA